MKVLGEHGVLAAVQLQMRPNVFIQALPCLLGDRGEPHSSSGPQFPHLSHGAYITFPVNTSSQTAANQPQMWGYWR